MKLIKFAIFEAVDGEIVSGTITKQKKRGEAWVVEDVTAFSTDEGHGERVFLLEDEQRLIIEGAASTKIIYDKEQNAARPVPMPQKRPITAAGADADESPAVPAVELAQSGKGYMAALEQERRDKLITEARERVKTNPPQAAHKAEHKAEDKKRDPNAAGR